MNYYFFISRMIKIYNKIHKYSSVISYFATQSWNFKSENVNNLCNRMSDKDKQLFFCNLKELKWSEFFMFYCRGIRLHIVKDTEDTIPEAKVRFNR